MLSGIVLPSIQKSHSINATLFVRSNWSNYYVSDAAFDADYAPNLNLTTNPVVEATRSMLRKMRGEGQLTAKPGFHVPVHRERGEKAN